MGIFGKIVSTVIDGVLMQAASNQAFEAGVKGDPPRAIFGAEMYREVYEKSYKLGQEAAKTNLVNTATRKLENL